MERSNIVDALEGADTEKATEVTYALDGAQPEVVMDALRRNLERGDTDLVEITAMRLGVRFNDAASFSKIVDLVQTHSNELVITASLKALSAIAERHANLRNEAEATLQTVVQASPVRYLREEAAREYLRLIGKISTRKYASRDGATILHRYKTVVENSCS